jgi:hypothetical protein
MEAGENYFGVIPVYIVQIVMIGMILSNKKVLCPNYKDDNHKYINYFLFYTYLMTFVGLLIADNYIEYRQLLVGFISLNVPLLGWLFSRPDIALRLLSSWYKYAWIPFFLFFFIKIGFVQFYWQPILILLCLFPLFRKPYAILILAIAMLYAFVDIEDQRAPFIKAFVAFVVGVCIGFREKIPNRLVRIGHVFAYLSVIFLFVYIFADLFVVLTGREDASEVVNNNRNREMIEKDTRSMLYIDVLNSSIQHDYFIFGHTPARGFEVEYSGSLFLKDDTILNKNERHKNEMVLSNIYTWEGLIGLILYSLIYMYGSYLAVYCSRNKITPFIGCFIAWRWAWGWVEDVNNFLCTDIDLWALIAICYSSYFRNMNDGEFKLWTRGLLSVQSRLIFLKSYRITEYAIKEIK